MVLRVAFLWGLSYRCPAASRRNMAICCCVSSMMMWSDGSAFFRVIIRVSKATAGFPVKLTCFNNLRWWKYCTQWNLLCAPSLSKSKQHTWKEWNCEYFIQKRSESSVNTVFLSVDSHSCPGLCYSLRNGAQPDFDCVSFNVSQDPRAVSITGAAITCVKGRQKQKEGLGDLGDKAWAHILVIAVVCSLSFSYWAHFACATSVLWLPKIKNTHVLHIHRCWERQKERFALVTQSASLHQFPTYLQCNQSSFRVMLLHANTHRHYSDREVGLRFHKGCWILWLSRSGYRKLDS